MPQLKATWGAWGDPFAAKPIVLCPRADIYGRCMEWRSQNERDALPGGHNDFETARLRVFAAPGSPQALTPTERATAESGLNNVPAHGIRMEK